MANGNYYLNQGIGTSGIAEVQNPIYAKKEYNPFKGIRAISRNVGQYFTSDSQYDKGLGDIEAAISEGLTVEDLRAENQSAAEMWGNALVNNLVIAGTTAISGTIGLVDGIIEAVGTGETNRLWNNTIDNWAVQQQEATRAAFPIYKGNEYEAKNTWEKLGTGIFWAEAFQNLGFTEGMLIPGIGVSKLISSAPKLARQIIPSFVSSIGEGSIEAINTKNDEVNSKIAMANARYNELANNITDPYQLDILNQDYTETIQAIEEDAKDAGNLVLATNIALLTATNTLEFGKMFSRGFGTSKRIANDMTRKGIKRTSEGLYEGLSMPMEITKAVGKKVLDATAEAGEEVSQEIIGRAPSNLEGYNRFNESQFNPEKRQLATDLMQGFIMSASEAMKDSHTYEAAAMGFVTGLFGVPMLKKRAIPVTIENSLFSEITEARDKVKRSNDIINNVNNRLSEDKKINAYYNGLVRHLSLQDDMNTALDNNDQFNYKNAESAQFISDMMMFDDLGDLNRLSDIINNSIDTSDEDIQALIEETSKDGEGPFMQNGNPIDYNVVRNIIEEKKKILNDKITSYKEAKDNYSKISPLLSEEALKAAIFYSQQMEDYKSRLDELMYTSYNGVRSINNSIEDSDFQLDDERTFRRKILTDSNYKDKILDLFNNEKSTIPYNKKQDIFKSINDAIKLSNSIMTYAESLEKLLKNPEEFNNSIDKSREKVAKVNKASEDIKKKDDIVNKSVSEINEAIDNGEMTEDDLLAMFPDGLPSKEEMSEVESKAKSALDIRDKTSKIKAEIDKSDADETTKNNAKKLIDNSKSLSDSLDDLTDLSSEAFNDPSFMYDELDPSLQGLDREALQDEVEIRLGGAKNLLSEMISIVEDNEGKLDNIPDFIPDETKESSIESTGHDSVDKNEPINKSKVIKTIKGNLADNLIQQAIDESNDSPIVMTLRDVIKDVDRLVNAGAIEKTIKKTIYGSASYKKAVDGFPGLVQAIDDYIFNKLEERDNKTPEVKEIKGSEYNPSMEDDVTTVNISVDNLHEYSNKTYKSLDKVEGTGGIYTSWLSPLSKYYRYSPKGDMTTFDQVAEGMNYTPEKLKRVKAIWNYLNSHDVFEYISSGNVKVGDKIGFAISQTLNDEAGELVVIMLQDNHIVGVLPSENDKEFANYAGLSDFMELLKREYQEAGTPSNFISKYHTSVNKIMVGRVPYTSTDETTILNNIFTEATSDGGTKEIPIELGISSGDGRNAEMIISSVRKGTSRSIKDKQRTIISPLNAKKGQPYLLVKTSDLNRAYISVPFSMPYYSQDTSDSALGIAIDNVLNSLIELQPKDVMKVKREIQELLAIPELHINILKNGNLKIDAKFQGDDKQTNIYNGRQDNPNLVQEVKSKLYGTPFQVSRKYINDTYKGQDYNRMIGELAYTNIDGTHTIDDWFTINPIDKEGNEFKGKTFKTTRNNPNGAKPQVFEYNWKGIPLKVDLNTFEVRDSEGNLKEGKNADIVKALAYGFKMNKTGVYKSPWGWFDSEKVEFVDEPKKEEVVKRTFALESSEEATPQVEESKEKPKTEQSTFNTPEQLEDQAKKKGLLGTPKRKELWKALNMSQQEAILSAKGLRPKQLMDGLDRAFNVSSKKFELSKLGGSVERYLGVKPMFRRITESKEQMTQREIKWLDKVLPKLTSENKIELVKGLIKISEEDGGGFAWGQFKQGVITLSNLAARGTVYHEAFHAVTHTLLNDSEYNELFKAGRKKYGNLSEVAIEEKLAEDFRRYMQLEEIPFIGRVVKIFRNLKHIIQNLLGKEPYLNKLYYSINNGIYSNRKPKDSNIIRNKEYIPYQILEQELDKFKYDYALVTANRQLFEKGFSSTYLSDVKNYINSRDLSMVLYPYFRNGRYHVGIISRDKYNREVQSMTRDIQESMYYGQPLYRRVISDEVKNDCATFLANFGIKIEELQDYNSDVPLFDAINRVINVRSNEDITKGTAYAVAFMMQHHKTMNELIVLKAGAESNLKNLRRSLRVRGDYEARMSKDARRGLKVENYIDEISDDIANELNKFYNNQTIDSNSNIIKKIWDVITSFFELLTPGARARFNVLHDYTRYIANAIILNDKSIILSSEHKPESNTELIEYKEGKEKAVLVNLEEAFRENPYEESIVTTLNKEGISLAGGASIAAERSLYRPADNPLHDLDFNAQQYSREQIKGILDKHYPNNTFIRHIKDDKYPDVRYTDTFLIMDRPFEIRKDTGLAIYGIYDKETGEHLGSYTGSELVLNEGINGKFLDFFMGEDSKPFPDKKMIFNGKEYLIANAKNALRAKAEWHRPKDIWDYARYIPEEMQEVIDLSAVERENKYKEKLQNAKIIWGHPAIGKTTYLETHDDIVEWDELINPERNLFFREQIDPEHKLDINSSEYKQLRSKYMSEWKEHPEYIEFLKEKWEWLKNKAKRENKRIFASPAPLLELFKDDFDLFIVLPEKEFMIRNQQRGGQYYASLGWKQIVNEKLINVDRSKILETSDYFSDFMKKYSLEGEARELEQHHREKYMLGNLSNEDKQFLIDKGISIEEYNRMSPFEREVLFHCR